MDQLVITGGSPITGTIEIGGAKNAALPDLCACLLTESALTLTGLPALADITSMRVLLTELGVAVEEDSIGGSLTLTAGNPRAVAPYDLVRKMRASILVLGPLLARCGEAQVSLPGGCAIGNRPIDLHLMGLKAMGADILLKDGYVVATAPKGLKGATITFPLISVGATENLMMAGALADGVTVLENAAREPEITDLANLLTAMGAKIDGAGGSTVTIEGRSALGGASHQVIRDRIEAGSYAVAAAMTGGRAELIGAPVEYMRPMLKTLETAGVRCTVSDEALTIGPNDPLEGFEIATEPYPGFPTDMQAQFMALATGCNGISVIRETIFENRFMHVPELRRMGADISVSGNTATVRGPTPLTGAQVMATDLRASMSLVIAALAAAGETVVNRVYHLDRGYERLEQKLRGLGANILRRQVPKAAG